MELFPIAKIACTKSVPLLKRRQNVSLNLPCSTASLLLQLTNSQQICCQWSKTRLCTSHDFLPFQLRNKIPKQTAHKTNYVRPSAKSVHVNTLSFRKDSLKNNTDHDIILLFHALHV